jgi:predicted permease
MLVVGIQLGSSRISTVIRDRSLVITSVVKMILWPALTFLAVNWLPLTVNMKIALVFGAAFPTAVAVVAISSMENRNAVKAAEIIAFTTLLSIITLPASALLLMSYYGLV